MTPALRWATVALVTVAVLAPAVLHRALPARAGTSSPAALADRARASTRAGWSGEVHTLGSLAVPKAGDFGGVARLFGSDSDLRVWWRDPESWRVDRIRPSGETDLVREQQRLTRWTYESRRATITPYSPVRLPYEADLLPPTLAARLLAGAPDRDLSALPARRIDGRSAAGVRYTPSDGRSSLARIEVWDDEASGVPLRVALYAGRARAPFFTTETSGFRAGRPSAETTTFAAAPGVRTTTGLALDDAAGANAFAPFRPPARLAGLRRTGDLDGAVGVYGRGATALALIPLRRRLGHEVHHQLDASSGAQRYPGGTIALRVGPLAVLLTGQDGAAFLVTGTVSDAVLDAARRQLAGGPILLVRDRS